MKLSVLREKKLHKLSTLSGLSRERSLKYDVDPAAPKKRNVGLSPQADEALPESCICVELDACRILVLKKSNIDPHIGFTTAMGTGPRTFNPLLGGLALFRLI